MLKVSDKLKVLKKITENDLFKVISQNDTVTVSEILEDNDPTASFIIAFKLKETGDIIFWKSTIGTYFGKYVPIE